MQTLAFQKMLQSLLKQSFKLETFRYYYSKLEILSSSCGGQQPSTATEKPFGL